MPSPIRFPIAFILLSIALLALGLAALRNPSPLWSVTIFTLAVTLDLIAVLGVTYSRGNDRPLWFGFAVFGLMYLIISTKCFDSSTELLPRVAADYVRPYINPRLEGVNRRLPTSPEGNIARADLDQINNFPIVCEWLGSIAFSCLGMFVGHLFSSRRLGIVHESPGSPRQSS